MKATKENMEKVIKIAINDLKKEEIRINGDLNIDSINKRVDIVDSIYIFDVLMTFKFKLFGEEVTSQLKIVTQLFTDNDEIKHIWVKNILIGERKLKQLILESELSNND